MVHKSKISAPMFSPTNNVDQSVNTINGNQPHIVSTDDHESQFLSESNEEFIEEVVVKDTEEAEEDGEAEEDEAYVSQVSSQIESVESSEDDSESVLQDLVKRRGDLSNLINEEASSNASTGTKYLIPVNYLDSFFSAHVSSFDELKSKLGQINCDVLVNSYGELYQSRDKRFIDFYSLSEEAWNMLVEWVGINGQPVRRSLIKNPQTGELEVEAYPPYFYIHSLTNKKMSSTYSKYSMHNNFNSSHIPAVSLSKLDKVGSLIDEIKYNLRAKNDDVRVWIIDCHDIENLSAIINLNNISSFFLQTLIQPSSYRISLQEATLLGGHLLMELRDQSTGKFPTDTLVPIKNSNGCVGLTNLGNTCYMNSALQCLVHIPEVAKYFLYDVYQKELNETNPLGQNGKIAIAFGTLIHQLFGVRREAQDSLSPRDFRSTVGHYNSMFADYHQQDSQEFLAFLLDALHEDLNRILHKPYTEKPELRDDEVHDIVAIRNLALKCWQQHKLRNDSLVIDLFVGLYKSTLICPDCSKISVTFDPFSDLTLPLPIEKKWYHKVNFFGEKGYPKTLEVELNKNSNIQDLKKYVASKLNIPVLELFAFEIFQNKFYRNFQSKNYDYLPITEVISKDDTIMFYHLKFDSQDLVVPVFQTVCSPDKSYTAVKTFAFPFFITLKPSETHSFGKIRSKLEERVDQLSTYNYFTQVRKQSKKIHSIDDFPLLKDEYLKYKRTAIISTTKEDDIEDTSIDAEGNSAYDSDISLANPDLSGCYAFDIKTIDDTTVDTVDVENNETTIYVPNLGHNHAGFKNLPNLMDKLSKNKKMFYTYENVFNSDKQDMIESDMNDKVIEDETEEETKFQNSPVLNEQEIGIETDSDEDFSNISPLCNSMDNLKALTSTVNSPLLASSVPQSDETLHNSLSKNFEAAETLSGTFDIKEVNTTNGEIDTKVYESRGPLVGSKMTLVCQWSSEMFDTFYSGTEDEGEGGIETWTNPEVIPNPELEANKKAIANKNNSNVLLADCLNLFSKPEILGEQDLWYCPNCRAHRQATKTIEIWKTSDILTIHLKRFESQRSFSDKIDMVVDFPINGLDMSRHVADDNGEPLIYDLIAVDNHYGGIGGGHYTAYVKNFVDDKWYYFNDSRVTPANPEDSITGAAYLLFYRKRSDDLLGTSQLKELIEKGRKDWDAYLKNIDEDYSKISSQANTYNQFIHEEELRLKEVVEESTSTENQLVIEVDGSDNDIEETIATKTNFVKVDTSGIPFEELTVKVSGGRSSSIDGFDDDDTNNSRRKQRLISRISKSNFNEKDSENVSLVSSPVSETYEYLSSSVSGAVPINHTDGSVCPSPNRELV